MILLSVVVCTFNRSGLLLKCLESLDNQTLPKDEYEVIIVDNNSTDDTMTKIISFICDKTNFRLVSEKKQGLSYARNRGYVEAKGEFVAYIDDDAIAKENWAEKILLCFQTADPCPDAVGGKIEPIYEKCPPSWFLEEFEIRSWGDNKLFLPQRIAKYGFSGSNMAFRKQMLEEYKGFSESYGMVGGKMRMGEDTEFFFRIHKKHKNFFYDPDLVVYHWTPEKNLKASNIVRRAYNSGIYKGLIDRSDGYLCAILKNLSGLFVIIAAIPVSALKYRFDIRKIAIKTIRGAVYRLGCFVSLFMR